MNDDINGNIPARAGGPLTPNIPLPYADPGTFAFFLYFKTIPRNAITIFWILRILFVIKKKSIVLTKNRLVITLLKQQIIVSH